MFSINDGPIWSIKFHPFVLSSENRIGLLAVTTANQDIYVFSLPYLKNDAEDVRKNLIISLEPSIICKLSEEINLHQEKYLMQACATNWYYRKDQMQLLAGGFVNGLVSIWNIDEDDVKASDSDTVEMLPFLVFQPHREAVTSIDFKSTIGSEIHVLTSSLERDIKVFTLDNNQIREIANYYSVSRNLCAQWFYHWPGYVVGNDGCFNAGSLSYRQPLEFGMRNLGLIQTTSSVIDLDINHWLNYVIFVTDSGDILGTNPSQMMSTNPKDRWQYFANTVLTFTDAVKIESKSSSVDGENIDEYGIIFNDIKVN